MIIIIIIIIIVVVIVVVIIIIIIIVTVILNIIKSNCSLQDICDVYSAHEAEIAESETRERQVRFQYSELLYLTNLSPQVIYLGL